MDEDFKETQFSLSAKGIFKIGYNSIRLMKCCVKNNTM